MLRVGNNHREICRMAIAPGYCNPNKDGADETLAPSLLGLLRSNACTLRAHALNSLITTFTTSSSSSLSSRSLCTQCCAARSILPVAVLLASCEGSTLSH